MIQGKFETLTVVAGADFDAAAPTIPERQYVAVTVAGQLADNNDEALGLSQGKPETGDHMTVAYEGHMKGRAGGIIPVGAQLMVTTNGSLIVRAGVTVTSCGKALTAAVAGDVFEFVGNFSNAQSTLA